MSVAIIALMLAQVPEDARRAAWERARETQAAFDRKLFADAGFAPLAEPDHPDRRQLLLRDPYGLIPVPGIELARNREGRVTMTIQHPGWREPPVAVPAAEWDTLALLESSVFAEHRYVPAPPRGDPPPLPSPLLPPPPICHGWTAYLAADGKARAGWAECGSGSTLSTSGQYALRMVAIAMRTRPGCEQGDGITLWAYQRCFTKSATLDDPALQTRFVELDRAYAALDAAAPLAAARRALAVPGITLGSPAWHAAREAVQRYREVLENRRQLLTWMRQLTSQSAMISGADRERIRRTVEDWQAFSDSQETNTVDLFARLAAAPQ